MLVMKRDVIALAVEKERIGNVSEGLSSLFGVTVGRGPFPGDLVPELRGSKHAVHQDLQVMAGCRVAVQVNRSRLLEHAVKLD